MISSEISPKCEYRINNDYFPFTDPSFEFEVRYNGNWLEILGCGVMQPQILKNCGFEGKTAWAFGLGLERLAMILFDIPDIRYFWSEDRKFLDQFQNGEIVKFKEYFVLDPLTKDISFCIPLEQLKEDNTWIHQNDFYELCREYCNDLIENMELFDIYYNKKLNNLSHCYHIIYRPVDTKLKSGNEFNKIVNEIHRQISNNVQDKLNIILR